MQDIYNLLSKHFLKETSEVEEKQIADFIRKNKTEYKLLKELWNREKIEVKDFDTQKAWQFVKGNQNVNNKRKILPLYHKIRKIAAVAAILLFGFFATYYFYKLNSTNMIVEQAMHSERGKLVLLSDGSKVYLNKNASLTYPEKFEKNKRNVILNGEAFFEVTKDLNKPFIVTTSNSEITVLGTSFNINAEIKDYTEVTVKTGKVKVNNSGKKSVVITPGFSAKVSKNELEKFETTNPNYLSWKTGKFVFKETPLKKVVKDLNTFYNDKILINGEIKDCNFTAEFDNLKIEEVIEILELTCNIKIKKN